MTITETSRKVLRGNYTMGPTTLMNYSSIDVGLSGIGVYTQVRPAQSLKAFELSISQTAETTQLETVIYGGKSVRALKISGLKAKFIADELYLTDGKIHHTEADLICGSPLKIKEIAN